MKIAIRTDSSHQIGSGHIIRCLTLARGLKEIGHECYFICRNLEGNLNFKVLEEFNLIELRKPSLKYLNNSSSSLKHENWAEVHWQIDALETNAKLSGFDFIICDHYSFDWRWEKLISKSGIKMMVIDDLADRRHKCDLLLDATLGRSIFEYEDLTDKNTFLIVGVEYALLRPEFKQLRSKSIEKRSNRDIKNILICLGSMDNNNLIPQILLNLNSLFISKNLEINILISSKAQNLEIIKNIISEISHPINIYTDNNDVGNIMLKTDIAISSCGLIFYELATMAVPTILIPVSDIQMKMARIFVKLSNCNMLLNPNSGIDNLKKLLKKMILDIKYNKIPRANKIQKFDGEGLDRVLKIIESKIAL